MKKLRYFVAFLALLAAAPSDSTPMFGNNCSDIYKLAKELITKPEYLIALTPLLMATVEALSLVRKLEAHDFTLSGMRYNIEEIKIFIREHPVTCAIVALNIANHMRILATRTPDSLNYPLGTLSLQELIDNGAYTATNYTAFTGITASFLHLHYPHLFLNTLGIIKKVGKFERPKKRFSLMPSIKNHSKKAALVYILSAVATYGVQYLEDRYFFGNTMLKITAGASLPLTTIITINLLKKSYSPESYYPRRESTKIMTDLQQQALIERMTIDFVFSGGPLFFLTINKAFLHQGAKHFPGYIVGIPAYYLLKLDKKKQYTQKITNLVSNNPHTTMGALALAGAACVGSAVYTEAGPESTLNKVGNGLIGSSLAFGIGYHSRKLLQLTKSLSVKRVI